MSHWLEEAEREEQRKKHQPSHESARFQDKKFRIEQNYQSNHKSYQEFIDYLNELCQRANNLPSEKKFPWNHIDFRKKESKLNNHLYIAATNKTFDKKVVVNTFPFVKRQHYKHIHSIFFSISKEMGMINLEVKDDFLAKTRLQTDRKKETRTIRSDGLPRVDVIFKYEINLLDIELAIKILDWLVFKTDLKSLPFREEHFKFKNHS